MQTTSKFLTIVFACAILSTPKVESKIFTSNGIVTALNGLVAILGGYEVFNNENENKDNPLIALQCSIAISTMGSLHHGKYKNFNTVANSACFFYYLLIKGVTADRKNKPKEILQARINALIMAAFYAATIYELNNNF
ncbi:MAG: hypothetical protein P4L22_05420 [Candidatus Babeliales bacterium]|nr:hypothetical protein [Candidatus Babeliales bacterium]